MTEASSVIKGLVAQILNTRELVINKGAYDGVELGMKFAVLDPKGQDIEDPETHQVLGSIRRPKVEAIVTRLEARLCVVRTFKYEEVNVGGRGTLAASGIAELFTPPKYVKKFETFRADEAAWQDIDESESYVKIGDPVEQVIEVPGGEGVVSTE